MCYSADVIASHKKFVRWTGTHISLKDFHELYFRRSKGEKVKIPRGMDAGFAAPQDDEERAIRALIDEFNRAEAARTEQELFKQRTRQANAERVLLAKPTKAAQESLRIASDKIGKCMTKLEDLRRTEAKPRDSRIYPGYYAPVMIMENGQRVIKPMRYQCRPAGKPASYDVKYPGTYNARRDNLGGFWKGQFGCTHGIMVVNAFYENVPLHKALGRELAPGEAPQNAVLEFRPKPPQEMLVACLWSRWTAPGEPDLLSFAAITDEPPLEVASAGHDRCIIQIRPENVDAWLNPDPRNLAEQYRILDDRPPAHYEHQMAA